MKNLGENTQLSPEDVKEFVSRMTGATWPVDVSDLLPVGSEQATTRGDIANVLTTPQDEVKDYGEMPDIINENTRDPEILADSLAGQDDSELKVA